MSMLDSKYKLSNSELEFVNGCLDMFELSGLAGLLNHMHLTDHSTWAFCRDEVLYAIAQSVHFDYFDMHGDKLLTIDVLVNLFRICLGIIVDQ
jgi:hypothetical protein